MSIQHFNLRFDRTAFGNQIARNGIAKIGVIDPVIRCRDHGPVAARKLMFPLRPGFNARQLFGNRKVDGLIVTKLKMQAGMIFDTAPISAK